MTRTNAYNGYTELDIMLLRAGAPTRFTSPYNTSPYLAGRHVDWHAFHLAFISPLITLINKATETITTPLKPNACTA